MATNIPIYQRTELPPARAGIAKPPYELADRPEIQFGQTLTGFGGAIFDKLVKAQAANEEAEARGQVNTLIESFSTFVADRPNASPEELQKEWDKISAQIKAIPGTLKTGIAEANFTNFLALNEGLINQRAQTSMEAIKSKQELGRFNAGRERAMTEFDIPGLTAIYEAQFESGLLEEKTGRIQLENDIAVIEEAEKKFLSQQLIDAIYETAKAKPYEEAMMYINEYEGITETQRNAIKKRREDQNRYEIAEYTTSDPEIEAKVLDQIRDPKSGITEEDISALVGKGLNVKDGDLLIGRLDVFKSFWFKRADMYLKQNLGWSDTFTKFEHPEGALAYSLAMDELFSAIETEKLKDKDLYDRARAIAVPHFIDYWEKALILSPEKIARLTRMLKIKPPTAKPPSEAVEKPPEAPPVAITPEKRPTVSIKEQAARKARIRSWIVPFNRKYKARLQPSVLDKMSDEFIDWLASLSPAARERILKKIEAGETVEIKKTKRVGSELDPERIWQ